MPLLAPRPETRELPYSTWLPIVAGAVVGIAYRLIFHNSGSAAFATMMVSFLIFVPVAIGATTVWVAHRARSRSRRYDFVAATLSAGLTLVGSMLVALEGIICVVLIAPLVMVLAGLSGLVMGELCRAQRRRNETLGLALLIPLLLGGVEQRIPVPDDVRTVTRSINIDARASDIWHHLMDTKDIQSAEIDQAWMYRIGVPLPLHGTTSYDGNAHVRTIRMGRGIRFEQVADVWQPDEIVRWRYVFAPTSFPPSALDDHVEIGGYYFDMISTQYRISSGPAGKQLTASMSYRVSTHFNWYVNPIAAFLIGDFLEAALELYRLRSER